MASSRCAAYALVALVVALGRDSAHDGGADAAKVDGLVTLAWDLCGLA